MFRMILTILLIFFYLLFTLPVVLFFKLTDKKHLARNRRIAHAMVRWLCKVAVVVAGIDLDVQGLENIPDEPVLFVGDHRGYYDIVAAYASLTREVGFVGKIEFQKIPLFSYWMEQLYGLFLDRQDMRQGLKVILNTADYMKEGTSMWIFPEGTRNHKDELLEFKEGSIKPAEKAGCAIVPVTIKGTDDVYENHRPFIKPAVVHIHYGKPVYICDLPKPERKGMGAKLREQIQTELQSIQ